MDSQSVSLLAAGASVIAAVVSGGVATWTGWQNRKAEKSLEAQKSEYTKELAAQQNEYTKQIEALKTQLAFSLARKSKLADAEYDALLGCWTKLAEVDRALGALMGGAIINQFSPDKIEGVIKTHPEQFSDSKIESLKKCSDDYKDTFENQRRHLMEDVSNAVKEFGIFFENKKIFLDPDIKEKFLEVGIFVSEESLLSALVFAYPTTKTLNEQLKKYTKNIEQYKKGIEKLITARLFPEERELSEKRA